MFGMTHISPHKAGLALGGTLGAWHLLWSVLVLMGWGQFCIDWIFRLHFIEPPYTVGPFVPMLAVGLIIVTSLLGYLLGWIFGSLWNWVTKS